MLSAILVKATPKVNIANIININPIHSIIVFGSIIIIFYYDLNHLLLSTKIKIIHNTKNT